jgi:hypothetical protein
MAQAAASHVVPKNLIVIYCGYESNAQRRIVAQLTADALQCFGDMRRRLLAHAPRWRAGALASVFYWKTRLRRYPRSFDMDRLSWTPAR